MLLAQWAYSYVRLVSFWIEFCVDPIQPLLLSLRHTEACRGFKALQAQVHPESNPGCSTWRSPKPLV